MIKKIKISINYKFLNSESGFVPYIHIGYINEVNEELSSEDLVNEKVIIENVPSTGYYFDDENKINECSETIPFNEISKYNDYAIENLLKNYVEKLDKVFDISYLTINDSSYNYCKEEKYSINFNSDRIKNSYFTGIHLTKNMEYNNNFYANDKAIVISKIFFDLFRLIRKNQIGFSVKKNLDYRLIDFEIDGLNLNILYESPSCLDVIHEQVSNNLNYFNSMTHSKRKLKKILKNIQ